MANTIKISIIMILAGVLSYSCKEETTKPEACMEVPASAVAGTPVKILSCTENADFVTIWTGDSLHNYALREDTLMVDKRGNLINNTGFDITSNGFLSYTYKESGTYTITLVASKPDNWGADVYKDVVESIITITDN